MAWKVSQSAVSQYVDSVPFIFVKYKHIHPRALTEHQTAIVYMWKSRVNLISAGQEESQSWVRMDGEQTVCEEWQVRSTDLQQHFSAFTSRLHITVALSLSGRKEDRKAPPSSVGSELPNPVILKFLISRLLSGTGSHILTASAFAILKLSLTPQMKTLVCEPTKQGDILSFPFLCGTSVRYRFLCFAPTFHVILSKTESEI